MPKMDQAQAVNKIGICNRYLPHNEERWTYIEDIPSQVKKNNSHLKQYLILKKSSQYQLGNLKTWASRLTYFWMVGSQRLRKYSDTRKIYMERICLVDLKIGCIKSVVWKNKQYIITKIFTRWWELLQSRWIAE